MMGWDEEDYKQLQDNIKGTKSKLSKPPKRKRGERGPNRNGLPKKTPPLDDGESTVNKCPDCGAVYDATETCSAGKNVRQFTRNEHGVGYDYFECFCKPSRKLTRYK